MSVFQAWSSSSFFIGLGLGLGLFAAHVIYCKTKDVCEKDEDEGWEDVSEDETDSENDSTTYNDEARGHMKMILVVRTDLKMTKGKAAAQCSHAAVAAYKMAKAKAPTILKRWERNGQPKVTVKVDSEDALLTTLAMARSLGLVSAVIADAGRTQIDPGSKTVVAVGPGPEKIVDQVTGNLKLY